MTLLRIPFLAAFLLLAACSKPGPGRSDAPSEQPKRNVSESLGFQSGEDYFASGPSNNANKSGASSAAGIPRVLTGRDGRTVEAVLLGRTADGVKIRRKADNAEFTIPFAKLSDADVAFIKKSAVPVVP